MNGTGQAIIDEGLLEEVSTSIEQANAWEVLASQLPILIAAFLVTLLVTPLFRRLAIVYGIVDEPEGGRKIHVRATPYLGGVAVFCGLFVGLLLSYPLAEQLPIGYRNVPPWIIVGLMLITGTGLLDDVTECDSWIKVAGQLIAAAGLAVSNVGTKVAAGLLDWLGIAQLPPFTIPFIEMQIDLTDIIGALIIAIFVLGGCNASNLIDGLDGLLSGVIAIVAVGLLVLSLVMIEHVGPVQIEVLEGSLRSLDEADYGISLAGARVVMSLALLGAVLGFLPHNFNPATIFLGDCGSLLLGYSSVVIILMLGEAGQTHLVLAGLIIFAIPIIDTLLAIIRRRVQGQPMWDPDARHMHHVFKSRLGSVKSAVIAIYGLGTCFALLGVALGTLVMLNELDRKMIYLVFLILITLVVIIGARMGLHQRSVVKSQA